MYGVDGDNLDIVMNDDDGGYSKVDGIISGAELMVDAVISAKDLEYLDDSMLPWSTDVLSISGGCVTRGVGVNSLNGIKNCAEVKTWRGVWKTAVDIDGSTDPRTYEYTVLTSNETSGVS